MRWDDLPTPRVLVDDLEKILHDFARYEGLPLLALRALPSVQLWHASRIGRLETRNSAEFPSPLDEQKRSNRAINVRIGEAIARMAIQEEGDALGELFDFGDIKLSLTKRYEAAAKHLGCSAENVRKVLEPKLLVTLADEMFRGELAWALRQLQPVGAPSGHLSVNAWGRLIELERSVILDEDDPRKQLWTSRLLIRCVKPDQPFWLVSSHWTGSGKMDDVFDNVTTLSGPQDGDARFRHRLLSVRPESDSADAYLLYLWDLGAPVFVGEDVELCWQQKFIDEKGTFKSFIGFGTEVHPELNKLRFRVKASPQSISEARGKQLTVQNGMLVGSYPSQVARIAVDEPIKARDLEGYFTYEPSEIVTGVRYELWWD